MSSKYSVKKGSTDAVPDEFETLEMVDLKPKEMVQVKPQNFMVLEQLVGEKKSQEKVRQSISLSQVNIASRTSVNTS